MAYDRDGYGWRLGQYFRFLDSSYSMIRRRRAVAETWGMGNGAMALFFQAILMMPGSDCNRSGGTINVCGIKGWELGRQNGRGACTKSLLKKVAIYA